MTKLFDCGECATGCYGRCMRAIVAEMPPPSPPDRGALCYDSVSMEEHAEKARKDYHLLGEMRESGVVWFNQNPHAYPLGTKFYADKELSK